MCVASPTAFARNSERWYTGRRLSALEAIVSFLSVIYLIAALVVALYGANALLLSVLYLRRRRDRPHHRGKNDDYPYAHKHLNQRKTRFVSKSFHFFSSRF